ncbi:cation transporting ATPase C-terminal domain-containing protein, partial [Enterobacter hormaechei]|uniref:cation transporting ATPase C-terminal domain-containing protein n=1 Tax=Enterobacter hormaechei TaxID=158836 RepID=UPI0025A2C20C
KGIWLVTGVLFLLQAAIIYLPFMQMLFGTEALPLRYWFVTLAAAWAVCSTVATRTGMTAANAGGRVAARSMSRSGNFMGVPQY